MKKFKRILIIDDDNLSNLIAKMAIKHSGITETVEIVTGAKEGLDIIYKAMANPATDMPDLIFLDLNMPIMDGWEFLEEYKKIEPELSQKITIIILSSSVFSKDIDRAQNHPHVHDYICKPLHIGLLKDLHKKLQVSLS